MKIIRPEQPKEENLTLIIDGHEVTEFKDEELIDDNTGIEIVEPTPVPVQVDLTIENLMDEIIQQKDDKVQITISLTKRQYDLYLKKGGESWIKRVITGQQNKRRKK